MHIHNPNESLLLFHSEKFLEFTPYDPQINKTKKKTLQRLYLI